MTVMKALELFNAGQLAEAISSAASTLRSKPADTDSRFLLAQLYCFQDEFEKADRQFETFASQATQPVPGIALCRQLIRAAKCRQEFYQHGRMPEFFSAPPVHVEELLRAWMNFRAGEFASAAESLQKSNDLRPASPGTLNDKPISDFVDLDDYLTPVLEVLTPTGKYFWVPLSALRQLRFKEANRPLDILWRPATLDVIDGPSGDAYVPSIYWNSKSTISDSLRLGRETDWREINGDASCGLGQKCFLAGDVDVAIMEIETISLSGDQSPSDSQ